VIARYRSEGYGDDAALKDMPLTGGKISSSAYSLVDCSIKIPEDKETGEPHQCCQ
jgi:hypothetical protein